MIELSTLAQSGAELDASQIRSAADALLDESVSTQAKAAFLTALAQRGESPAEIAGFAQAFLGHARDPMIDLDSLPGPAIDVCGTGGDQLHLFNVSTTAMFMVAAAGAVVVKHGNRGITSKSGGADVLEALGVRIDLPPGEIGDCLRQTGVGFLFAPLYHPAFKTVAPVRKELAAQGQRTMFNLLGPLLNPAQPRYQLVGVFGPKLPPVLAEILGRMGRTRAWAVHGTTADGQPMDELSTLGPTCVCRIENGQLSPPETIEPAQLGLPAAMIDDLEGGDAEENARILLAILSGEETGPKSDLAVLNASAALVITGLAESLGEGLSMARETVRNGKALEKLQALQAWSS